MRMGHALVLGLLIIVGMGMTVPAMAGQGHHTQNNPFSAVYPDPARLAGEVRAFTAADSLAMPEPGALLCLGSSSIRMWHPTLARDLAPRRIIARGFGGSTMLDALHFAPRIVLPYRPAAILLYEGDNDIDFGVEPAEYMAAFAAFLDLVWAEMPEVEMHVLAIKPSGLRWARWPAMQEANRLLAERCAADARLHFIDVASPLLDQDGLPRDELFLADRLHLNADGYAVWAAVVNAALPAP